MVMSDKYHFCFVIPLPKFKIEVINFNKKIALWMERIVLSYLHLSNEYHYAKIPCSMNIPGYRNRLASANYRRR